MRYLRNCILACTFVLSACNGHGDPHEHAAGHEHAEAHTAKDAHGDHGDHGAEPERGPNRGRMLREGAFAIEVTIFETGVPPQYRLYAYHNDQPLPPEQVQATVELSRLDGEINRFAFSAQGPALVGDGVVGEPHSFDVVVQAQYAGQNYRWSYPSHEGRTTIPAAVAAEAGVRTEIAGPATIQERLHLMGRVVLDADRFAEVRSAFSGPVREVHVSLGDPVRAGQTLAVIENRDSLRTLKLTAPIDGIVLARHTNVGDVAGDGPLFEIADLDSLWIELNAFGAGAQRLAPGQAVTVTSVDGTRTAHTRIDRLLPLVNAESQTLVARATLANAEGLWRPGTAVAAEVTVAEREVPLAVRREALQRFRDFTVVFAQVGDTYEVRMLETGTADADRVEVLGGLKPGTPYVTEQSFLIKADIEKSGASHDH